MRYFVLMFLAMVTPAAADEVSPWFGSADQVPFQMASDGKAVLTPGRNDVRAELGKHPDCAIEGCSVAESVTLVRGKSPVSP